MKKLLIVLLSVSAISLILGFVILFEGNVDNLSVWWKEKTRNSDWIYSSHYKDRRVDSDSLHFKDANDIVFIDKNLFWRGSGVIVEPKLDKEDFLHKILVKKGGSGFSKEVVAKVTGAMANEFELGPVTVEDGEIKKIVVAKKALWNFIPLAFYEDEEFPFSGTAEEKYSNGQVMIESKYLSGVLHGKEKKFTDKGIPLYEKDFKNGLKEGTHIYWFPQPLDPDDYEPSKDDDAEVLPSLWLTLRKKARDNFGAEFDTQESNEWVVKQYKLKGGKFPVRLLEHWKNNLPHGLFEGYDRDLSQLFESEYNLGQRIKHKAF
jgi:hypothetical protein